MITCIEGLDGAGKSGQAGALAELTGARLFKFPERRSPSGQLIYAHLEEAWNADFMPHAPATEEESRALDALVFQSLQLTNRMEVATEIMTAAAHGDVVFDRYWPSGYAYGKADGLDGEYLINLHRWLPQPDLFLLLDIDPGESLRRRPERRDRYEKNPGHLADVAFNYRELWVDRAEEEPDRWVIINARSTPESVAKQIQTSVHVARERLGR